MSLSTRRRKSLTKADDDYLRLTADLQNTDEDALIASVHVYIDTHGVDNFLTRLNKPSVISRAHFSRAAHVVLGTFFYASCSYGYLKLADKLLDLGADIDVRTKATGTSGELLLSPFMFACAKNDIGLATFLLARGAFIKDAGKVYSDYPITLNQEMCNLLFEAARKCGRLISLPFEIDKDAWTNIDSRAHYHFFFSRAINLKDRQQHYGILTRAMHKALAADYQPTVIPFAKIARIKIK